MTTAELIAALEAYPQDAEVYVAYPWPNDWGKDWVCDTIPSGGVKAADNIGVRPAVYLDARQNDPSGRLDGPCLVLE